MEAIFSKGAVLGAVLLLHTQLYSKDYTNPLLINQNKEANMETIQSQSKNKAAIRDLYENIMNNRKFERLKDLIAEDYTGISAVKGAVGFQKQLTLLMNAFPDAIWQLEEIMEEGNKVMIKQQFHGTHTGEFQHIAATGKMVSNTGTGFYEFKEGKIISSDIQTDRLSFMQQLGIIPTDLTSHSVKKETGKEISFIDKFFIPKNSIEEFIKTMRYNRSFVRALPGFIRDEAFEQKDEAGNLTIVTVAVWANQDSLNNAKNAIQSEFKRLGFNPTDFYQRLHIKLERGLYQLHPE